MKQSTKGGGSGRPSSFRQIPEGKPKGGTGDRKVSRKPGGFHGGSPSKILGEKV